MNRFCSGLLTVFRFLQLLLSLTALGCCGFITYTMFSMASSARHIETSIERLINDSTTRYALETDLGQLFVISDDDTVETLTILDEVLGPLLHILEGTPTRAIIVSAVSLWSVCFIIYLYIAQKSTHHPNLNKRSNRILLESLTLLLWITGIVCSILLALEYGGVLFAGGAELKLAWSTLKAIIEAALKDIIEGGNITRELAIVDDLFTIGALSILAVVASSICCIVSIISLFAACCISGKPKDNKRNNSTDSESARFLPADSSSSPQIEKKTTTKVSVYEMSPSSMTPTTTTTMTMTPPTPASIPSWSPTQYHDRQAQQQQHFPIPKYHYPQRYQPVGNHFNRYDA